MHGKHLTPEAIDKRTGKPRNPLPQDRRPTIVRSSVRTELFGGWGPKL